MYSYTLTGKCRLLPHIFEDIFFRTYLAAESRLLNTVVQVAERDSWPSFLEILLNITKNLLAVRHLRKKKEKKKAVLPTERKKRRVREWGLKTEKDLQSVTETCAV